MECHLRAMVICIVCSAVRLLNTCLAETTLGLAIIVSMVPRIFLSFLQPDIPLA